MAKIPVTLNPRFGVLNTTEKTIIDGLSDLAVATGLTLGAPGGPRRRIRRSTG